MFSVHSSGWCTESSFSSSTSLSKEHTPVSDTSHIHTPASGADEPDVATTCANSSSSLSSSHSPPEEELSAEVLAQQLVSQFRKSWLTLEEQELLPDNDSMATEDMLSLADEIRQRSRMRGTLTWAPPRFQIIFSTHPTQKRSVVVASQGFLCAGCGTQVEAKYLKKLRYCEYLGRYFCACCHGEGEAVIPGRVLECWDFCRYPVCDFSLRLLASVWHQPLFPRACLAKTKARELARFTEVQEQLVSIKKLLTVCRFSDGVLQELAQLPGHLTQEPLLVSLDDLQRIKRGQLLPQARALLHTAVAHVESCPLCRARGFICEFCQEPDLLFPFHTLTCKRCTDCKACFHTDCFRDEECPKCLRIETRSSQTHTELNSS
ncbi:hypothetical protein AAFF_G00230910 [Aldrovandia affinis]|uniref:Rubicon Homology domain-containing protein n=1 Tax=Aldrovandia affinis TaxID=143900 RepID=A0AAD7RF82_9TELE|nr:hypothetical protein AAFF_G00230910 [Aldrovandia affinis]